MGVNRGIKGIRNNRIIRNGECEIEIFKVFRVGVNRKSGESNGWSVCEISLKWTWWRGSNIIFYPELIKKSERK